jgi:twitching motility protein PilI
MAKIRAFRLKWPTSRPFANCRRGSPTAAGRRTEPVARVVAGVECSSRGFLFPLRDAGEIFALAPLVPVPHSHPWFLGVANLRGHLHGVVDLASFLGVKRASLRGTRRAWSGFNQAFDINCVLLVDRLAGLRSEESSPATARTASPGPALPGRAIATARSGCGRS